MLIRSALPRQRGLSARTRSLLACLSALACGALVTACPPADKADKDRKDPPPAVGPCARFGQTCEVSPGKLGTCVQKASCNDATPACLICQSQH